jgi:hypothetical protein
MIQIIDDDPIHLTKNALLKDCKKCLYLGLMSPPDVNGNSEFCTVHRDMKSFCDKFHLWKGK